MKVSDVVLKCGFEEIVLSKPNAEVTKVFCGDLLSHVMSKVDSDSAWVTIMSNVNTVGVASLVDIPVVILADGMKLDENSLNKAKLSEVNIISSQLSTFETALKIHEVINNA